MNKVSSVSLEDNLEENAEMGSDKKERILQAAERLFSQQGFDAVSTRSLAKEAGVNIAMLSYYFGSKEKLYETMIHNLIEKRRDNLKQLLKEGLSPMEKVFALVDFYVDKVFGQGEAYKIFMRELSNETISIPCSEILDSIMNNMNIMKEIFEEGYQLKVFKKVDMEMTIMTLVSSVHHLSQSQNLSQRMFNLNFEGSIFLNPNLKARIKDHLKSLLKAHLSI